MLEANEEAWELWCAANTQWRAAGFGVVGLDYTAVLAVADVLGIVVTAPMLQKVAALERFELERVAKRADG